jgi:RimJ/RimL family protein N-acetyltransferase
MILTLDRLILREFVTTDWRAVHEYASDPKVVQYVDWGPNEENDTRTFVQRAVGYQRDRQRRDYELAIVLKENDRLIGGCALRIPEPEHRQGSIGYALRPDMWSRGYATEAARGLVTFGFTQLKLHRIFATCDPDNVASARVMEKIGMRREAHLREHKWMKNRWRDSLVYGVLENEWGTMSV